MTTCTTCPDTLSAREMQVLRGMSQGHSNSKIGAQLFLSEDTVKTHARRLFRKLGASDRAHAVALAFHAGVLTVEGDDVTPTERVVIRKPPAAAPLSAPPATTPGARAVNLEVSERGAVRLLRAVYPEHVQAPWALERCTAALHRLAEQVTPR